VYSWYIDQVEYSHNLIFRSADQGTAIVKLKECLDGTVGEALDEPPQVGSPQTLLQTKFRQVRRALVELLETVGLNAA
jgi:hypothetical protein